VVLAQDGPTELVPMRLSPKLDAEGRCHQLDAAVALYAKISWRRSDVGSDLLWEREMHDEGQNRGSSR
jgi:hypothetical protein